MQIVQVNDLKNYEMRSAAALALQETGQRNMQINARVESRKLGLRPLLEVVQERFHLGEQSLHLGHIAEDRRDLRARR